mgnify:CR=1 FL=1
MFELSNITHYQVEPVLRPFHSTFSLHRLREASLPRGQKLKFLVLLHVKNST